ncbi:unnamed protein product, partial [Symbiodinium pilosum]
MALRVHVALLSGRHAAVDAQAFTQIGSVKWQASAALGARVAALATACGLVLHEGDSLQEAHVKDGDTLFAVVGQTQVLMSRGAGAKLLGDGSVETWGRPDQGGDCQAVK